LIFDAFEHIVCLIFSTLESEAVENDFKLIICQVRCHILERFDFVVIKAEEFEQSGTLTARYIGVA
jgi:hypothetical protein